MKSSIKIPPEKLQILRLLINQAGGQLDRIIAGELHQSGETHGYADRLGLRVEFWANRAGVSFAPAGEDLEAIASDPDFAFAAAKNCTKGLSCGDSCISKNKTCKKPLTQAQAAQHKALIGRVMGSVVGPLSKDEADELGDGGATDGKSVPKKNSAEELAKALEAGDYDRALEFAQEIESAAKQRARDAVVNDPDRYGSYDGSEDDLYLEGISAGNGRPDDWILKELWAAQGFDGKPQLVDAATIDAEIAAGSPSFYRGFGSTPERFDNQFEAIKSGDYYAGHGIYGHDTYAALSRNSSPKNLGNSIAIANEYGSNGGGIRGVIAKDAVIVKQSALNSEMVAEFEKMRDWAIEKNNLIEFGVDSRTLARDTLAEKAKVEAEYSGTPKFRKDGALVMVRADGTEEAYPDLSVQEDSFAAMFSAGAKWSFPGATKNYKTKKAAAEAAAEALKQQIAADRMKSKYNGDPVAAEKFRRDSVALGRVVLGDAVDSTDFFDPRANLPGYFDRASSGRYATIKGYDVVDLDQAYESNYALTLNRSKYILQEEPFFRK